MQVYANMESLKKLDALESFETEELKVKLRKQNDADNHLHFWLILCISKESLKFNTYFMTLIRKEPHQPTCFFRLISSGETRSVTLQWIDVIRKRNHRTMRQNGRMIRRNIINDHCHYFAPALAHLNSTKYCIVELFFLDWDGRLTAMYLQLRIHESSSNSRWQVCRLLSVNLGWFVEFL